MRIARTGELEMGLKASVTVAPLLREHDGGVHDDHPLLARRAREARALDLNSEPWALVCGSVGVSVDGEEAASASREPEDHDGVVWAAQMICRHDSRVQLGGTPIVQRVDNDAHFARWSSIEIFKQILDYEIPRLLELDIEKNPWLGRLIIYRLLEVTEADRGHVYGASKLTGQERAWVAQRLREVVGALPPAMIESYEATPVAPNRLAAFLALAGGRMPKPALMADIPSCPARRVNVFHADGTRAAGRWLVDGESVQPASVKTIDHRFFDDVFVQETIVWLPRGEVELVLEGIASNVAPPKRRGPVLRPSPSLLLRFGRAVSWRSRKLINRLAPVKRGASAKRAQAQGIVGAQPSETARKLVWLYMDRHDSAGDNAEPLYRYASRNVPGVRHVFALERTSGDWNRLEGDGFDLVDINGEQFDDSWAQADVLLLADIGDPIAHPRLTGNRTRRDQTVVFLQHGVTMRDMWRWMNGKRIDYLVTATEAERDFIAADHSSYALTEPQVLLTGFPRHDLLHPLLGRERDRIVLAPTWRVSLAHRLEADPEDYAALHSAYAPWLNLAERLESRGFHPVLFVHPKIALLAPQWMVGLGIEATTGRDVPDQLSQAIATVSDRSSLLDDAMLLGGAGIVWDPSGAPDTDHYRANHVSAGACEALSADDVLDLVDGISAGRIEAASDFTIPDDRARERLVARLLDLGFDVAAEERRPRMIGHPRVSLVAAVFGVEEYLPAFFDSLDAQDYPHEDLEVILICDGVKDASPRIYREWAERTDISVTVIEQANAGQGAARNRGFIESTGEWIGFPDPDDTINPEYVSEMMAARDLRSPLLVSRMRIRKNGELFPHPLDFRFAKGIQTLDAETDPRCIQLATNCCLIHREAIEALGSEPFPEDREAATFEDAMLIGELRAIDTRMVVVPDAEYIYEKRSAGDSTVQSAWTKPGRYLAQFTDRYLPYLERSADAEWAQQTVLYDLGWYFQHVDGTELGAELEAIWPEHIELLTRVLAHIDRDQILYSPWSHLTGAARARLYLLKGEERAYVVDRGAVLESYSRDFGAFASSRGRDKAMYGPHEVGSVLKGAEAEAGYEPGIPRIPVWPTKPRLP